MARKVKFINVGGVKVRAGKTHEQVAAQLSRIDTAAYHGNEAATRLMGSANFANGTSKPLISDYKLDTRRNFDPWGRRSIVYTADTPNAKYASKGNSKG